MARDSSLSQEAWNAKYSGGVRETVPCVSCVSYVLVGPDGDVETSALQRGWLPCLERRWQCSHCWSAGVWQHVHSPVVASVWLVAKDNAGADAGLPTGWFLIESNSLTGGPRRYPSDGDWWLSDGYTSHACLIGSWLVVQEGRVRVEPADWLGRLMVESGVMADEPF